MGGSPPRFAANVSGSSWRQVSTENGPRVVRSAMNNQRIFTEFGVSPNDYALVMDTTSSLFLALVPKSSGSGLDIIPVLVRSDVRSVNEDDGTSIFETQLSNGDALGNSFQGLRGSMQGTAKFSSEGVVRRFTGNINASGGDSGPLVKGGAKGINFPVIMKFKVTRGALFTQAP